MKAGLFISRWIRAEIQNPAPRGQRHRQSLKLALSLLGGGLAQSAVFSLLRSMHGPDFPDREIRNIIDWASARNPRPWRGLSARKAVSSCPVLQQPAPITAEQAVS